MTKRAVIRPVIVLKLGGSLQGRGQQALIALLREVQAAGCWPIVIHGGGPQISEGLRAAGIELPFVAGQRQTTVEAMAVVADVLQQINRRVTETLTRAGFAARGFDASSPVLLHATPVQTDSRTGVVQGVETSVLSDLLAMESIPVIPPIAYDGQGLAYNVNADLAAAAVAGACRAQSIVFFTDVPGIYADFSTKTQLYDTNSDTLRQLMSEGQFVSGMIPKVTAVLAALDAGVEMAYVVDGQNIDSVLWTQGIAPNCADARGTKVVAR